MIRSLYITSKGLLDPHWIFGFITGDGCFTFYITDKGIRVSYAISLHKREEPLLLKILKFFGSKDNVGSWGTQTSVEYKISTISDLSTHIIPHFDNYQVFGVKFHNYTIWCEIILLLSNKTHHTQEGLVKLRELRFTLNKI